MFVILNIYCIFTNANLNKYSMKEIAYRLIGQYSVGWLCDKMELNYRTLMNKIENDLWKESEKLYLTELNKKY